MRDSKTGAFTKIGMVGSRSGRLIVMREYGRVGNSITWECLCDCGNTTVVQGAHLRNGGVKSCGCLRRDRMITHGLSKTPTYRSWDAMVQRCTNQNNEKYKDYGARGISICDKWLTFDGFFDDMGEKPKELTIDRVDNDRGYSRENCRWATDTEQSHNKRARIDSTTGVAGITATKNKTTNRYRVRISAGDRRVHIGYFDTLEQASVARKQSEEKYWREAI